MISTYEFDIGFVHIFSDLVEVYFCAVIMFFTILIIIINTNSEKVNNEKPGNLCLVLSRVVLSP